MSDSEARQTAAQPGTTQEKTAENPAGPDESAARATRDLRAAWNDLMTSLAAAREAIDDPKLHPPPPDDRNLAEGYRYLLGYLYGAIGRVLDDPMYPNFRRAIEPLDKATIDNADAVYLYAPIDGNHSYVVRARAGDTRHWRGEAALEKGPKAPQYVIFETPSGYVGDSGSIAELRPGTRANGGVLDSASIEVEPDGSFEVLLAPERPAGHRGNFLATKAYRERKQPDGSKATVEYTSQYVVLRELFHDWEHEDLLDLEIVRLGAEGTHPEPLDAPRAAAQMRRMGEIVDRQMRYWNEFYAIVLETYADVNGDGKRFMPRNDLNEPNVGVGFGGQATNVYAGGVYELAPDEALIVEVTIHVAPAYSGFHLSNLWGESLDFANHQSSVNGHQVEPDPDGVRRYVVAHRDPGVPNWLDTTGLREGFLSLRWSYSTLPERMPELRVTKVRASEVRSHLPATTRTVSVEERRERIRVRQSHVQRRYRQY